MENVNLGDVVALKSHPYDQFLENIIICGEPQFVSPLMVIVEFYKETKDQFDEKTGNIITEKGSYQCKCIWYSSKNHQFEESWISSKLLKHIQFTKDESEYNLAEKDRKLLIGRLVSFKTNTIEFKKRKNSISIEASSTNINKDKNITTPLLAFTSPIMQIIQVSESKLIDPKELSYDQKTGEKKRFTSKWLIKCKWYNANDKISEKFLPLECLKFIPLLPDGLLTRIKERIEELRFYKLRRTKNEIIEYTLIDPKEIQFANGYYTLKAFDYLENKTILIELESDIELIDIEMSFSSEGPNFDLVDGEILPKNYFLDQYLEIIKLSKDANKYLRIVYKNRTDTISTRTLKDYSVINIVEGEATIQYLKGFCLSSKANRTFRVENIQKIQQLNLSYS